MALTSHSDIRSFKMSPDEVEFIGNDLSRPECVVAERDGTLWIADNRGAVTRRDPDGRQELLGAMKALPNGIAMSRDGTLYIANIGDQRLYRMQRNGREEIVLDQFEGKPLGSLNFIYFDDHDRIWATVSTVTEPRRRALDSPIADGSILRLDGPRPRRVADKLVFANEVRVDPHNRYLYVAETTAGRISRHALLEHGELARREPFGSDPLFPGARVDGIAFDAAGNLWVTELTRNALIVLTPAGESHTVLEDPQGRVIQVPTSVAFGGPDLTTVYVGSLTMRRIVTFRSPIPGWPMVHWNA